MAKRYYIIIILFVILITTALIASDYFFKKTTKTPQGNDSLTQVLSRQSELKKFSTAAELKDFFAQRPTINLSNSGTMTIEARDMAVKQSAPMAAPLGLGGDTQGTDGGSGGMNFSGTNIQVAGVDEADIVKTDGTYIYMVREQNLIIIKATPAGETKVVSITALEGSAQELYIKNNKVAIFGYSQMPLTASASPLIRYYPSATFFALYDVSDSTKPALLRRLEFEGNYLSSRLIDNQLYFITTYYNFYPAADVLLPRVFENGETISAEATTSKYQYPMVYYIDSPSSLNATTVAIIKLDQIDSTLNSQVFLMPAGETVYASTKALYIAYTKYISEYELRMAVTREIVAPKMSENEQKRLLAISAIDSAILSDDEKLAKINQMLEMYLSRLSAEDLKRLNSEIETNFKQRHPDLANELEKTVIHKLTFNNGSLAYLGSGEITGRLLNQYSLDEQDGYLRLATTRNQQWFQPFLFTAEPMMEKMAPGSAPASIIPPQPPAESQSINNVYVLDPTLRTIGQLENFAPGERIYSARFIGFRVYLVTFRQTDPLFVIDLSKPEKPTVLGQVKLPGFSNYLHPYSETVLIGIGKEAIDKGAEGVDLLGLKISLFNVEDPTQPKEISHITLGGRGSDSLSLFDYKAVLFDKEKKLLAIPATLTSENTNDYQTSFQGTLVFTITPNTIIERGRVAFRLPTEMSSNYQYIDDTVRRNLYIGDYLYSLSPATVKVSNLNTITSVTSATIPQQQLSNQGISPVIPYVEDQTLPTPSR